MKAPCSFNNCVSFVGGLNFCIVLLIRVYVRGYPQALDQAIVFFRVAKAQSNRHNQKPARNKVRVLTQSRLRSIWISRPNHKHMKHIEFLQKCLNHWTLLYIYALVYPQALRHAIVFFRVPKAQSNRHNQKPASKKVGVRCG
jgi:hypothetical protein